MKRMRAKMQRSACHVARSFERKDTKIFGKVHILHTKILPQFVYQKIVSDTLTTSSKT